MSKYQLIDNELYEVDPQGPDRGYNRVLRGGSWGSYAQFLSSGYRNFVVPGERYYGVGFRLLRTKNSTLSSFNLLPFDVKFAFIPAGKYKSENGNFIISNSFELQTTQVTQKQWNSVIDNNPSKFIEENNPVERVNYEDVHQFIQKLNNINDGYTYRLPTEFEWELACADSCFKTGAWVFENSKNTTHSVAKLKPNKYGLYDMLGNVWEWCSNYYEEVKMLSEEEESDIIKSIIINRVIND